MSDIVERLRALEREHRAAAEAADQPSHRDMKSASLHDGAADAFSTAANLVSSAIEERDRRIAELEGENAWQPIETAPKDGVDIMAWPQPISRQPFVAFWDEARGGQWSQWPGRDRANPTHWRPLPTPPQEIATTEGSGHG